MRFTISLFTALATTAVNAIALPPDVPTNILEFRDKHPYEAPEHDCRPTVTIRASENEWDDVSEDFRSAIYEVNNGGTLYLPKGNMYVIGKVLDLTGLDDVHLRLDGEIRVSFEKCGIGRMQLRRFSSPTTLSIGKRMPGTIPSRNPSCSGNGEETTSRSTAPASSRAKGMLLSQPSHTFSQS